MPFCNCNSIKAKGAALRLGASLAVRNGARQGENQRRSAEPRTLSRSGYIQGNNTLWTAGLQKCGVMIYHSVAQFVVRFLTNTPRLAPLTLHPGCISLTWPPQLMWCVWREPALLRRSGPEFQVKRTLPRPAATVLLQTALAASAKPSKAG